MSLKFIILSSRLRFYECLLVLNSQWVFVCLVTVARKALPELLDILTVGTKGGNESDDTLAMACQTSNCLLMKEQAMGKFLVKYDLIKSLKELSQNG